MCLESNRERERKAGKPEQQRQSREGAYEMRPEAGREREQDMASEAEDMWGREKKERERERDIHGVMESWQSRAVEAEEEKLLGGVLQK